MTRAELQETVEALAKDLGRSVDTQGLSRAKLEGLLEELRAAAEQPATDEATSEAPVETVASAPAETGGLPPEPRPDLPPPPAQRRVPKFSPADGAAPFALGGPPPPSPRVPRIPNVPYYVAPRRSVMAREGKILGPLKPVKPSDFETGQAAIDSLVERGIVIARK